MPVVRLHGVDIALAICEDLWQDGGRVPAARSAGAGLLLSINASPYERDKDDTRLELVRKRAQEAGCTTAYLAMIGGQDELVFDGDSIVVAPDGEVLAGRRSSPRDAWSWTSTCRGRTRTRRRAWWTTVCASTGWCCRGAAAGVRAGADRRIRGAPRRRGGGLLGTGRGLRAYVKKNGFRSVLIGLSGGIDSALVAAIACDAIGAENVYGVSMPSKYSSEHSRSDAAELARRTGLHFRTVAIEPMFAAYMDALGLTGLAEENLQSRLAGRC